MARKLGEAKDALTGEVNAQIFVPPSDQDALSIALRVLTQQLIAAGLATHVGGGMGGSFGYGVVFENDTFFLKPDYMDEECDCGHESDSSEWFKTHPHSADCYQTVLASVELSPNRSRIDELCRQRNSYEWGSVMAKSIQNQITALSESDHEHSEMIYRGLCDRFGIPWNDGRGCAVHCSCDHEPSREQWFKAHDHAERCPIAMPNFWHKPSGLKVDWYKWIGRDNSIEAQPIEGTTVHGVLSSCLSSFGRELESAITEYETAEREAHEASMNFIEWMTSDDGQAAMQKMEARGVIKTFVNSKRVKVFKKRKPKVGH